MKDRAVVWENPITGEFKVPPDPDAPLPSRYEMQGFVRREFNSYFEHSAWCRKHGVVNHKVEGIHNDDDALGKNRWGY